MRITLFLIFVCVGFITKSQIVIGTDSMPVAGRLHYQLYDKAKVVGSSKAGTVYALPQDHMPALRPDTNMQYNMPVKTCKSFQIITVDKNYKSPRFKDSLIQTPYGPKKLLIPVKPDKE